MFIIWHDSDFDLARWVYLNTLLSKTGEDTIIKTIPGNSVSSIKRGLKKDYEFSILPIIKYETPDIIIQHVNGQESKILFVAEFMTHTPQWQHPAQRFARIYGASKLGIPVALILPEMKLKLEKGNREVYKKTYYRCSPSVYALYYRTNQISHNPALIYHWPQEDGWLKYDNKHPTAPFVDTEMDNLFKLINILLSNESNILNEEVVKKQKAKMERSMNTPSISDFDSIEGLFKTSDFISRYNLKDPDLINHISKRDKSLIFRPTGLKCNSSRFRTDPYAGMLCAFDNLFCRDSSGKRTVNLILRADNIKFDEVSSSDRSNPTFEFLNHSETECPFTDFNTINKLKHIEIIRHIEGQCPYTRSKQQRIYGEVSDLIIFDDKVFW